MIERRFFFLFLLPVLVLQYSQDAAALCSASSKSCPVAQPQVSPPSLGATPTEIAAYVDAVRGSAEALHGHDGSMASEHVAALQLVARSEATHIAVTDGDWFDPSTWFEGQIPGDGSKVLIPEGIDVEYDSVSAARLFTLRIDGTLEFSANTDSQMIFDTMVVSPTGHLIIGTEAMPVDSSVTIDLIVANNGEIDTNWDPMLLSRGLITHGKTTIHGAPKDSHEKVIEDPMSGDTFVSFSEIPSGWQVGDVIVIAGTRYDGHMWDNDIRSVRHYESEDEVRVISAISDNKVFFDQPLEHNHDAPRDDLSTSVANYTRNVSIETENGTDAEVYERGHVMFMHSDDIDVRYMEFAELGRTDKSIESFNVNSLNSLNFDSNVQGRYSVHLHRTGIDDIEDPAVLEGNAIFGSPGWGVVHHDSNALISNTATFNTFGAGFVAETGNETGSWHDNIAIFAEGIDWGTPKSHSTVQGNFDTARGGDGFYFQGRMVASTDNVAASVNTGFAYYHRDYTGTMLQFDSSAFEYPDALLGDESVSANDTPILEFSGNEVIAANRGLYISKGNSEQGHDVWSHLDDFTAWSVRIGAELEYTAHYLLTDFDLIGREAGPFHNAQYGIALGTNMSETIIKDSVIEDFRTGISLKKIFIASGSPTAEDHDYILIDNEFINVDQNYEDFDPALDRVVTASQLAYQEPNLEIAPIIYSGDTGLRIQGTKTDSLGTVDFPGGIDNFDIPPWDAPDVINHYGYWTTTDGQNYSLIDIYFTDRTTGEIFFETHPILFPDNLEFGSQYNPQFAETQFNGVQDITTEGLPMILHKK